jgi:anti-sigma factor RsiW
LDCEEVTTRLPWLLTGRLEESERQAVEAHVRDCAACRGQLDPMREAAAVFGAHLPRSALVALAWERPAEGTAADTARRHLETCPECAEELSLLQESRRAEGSNVVPLRPAARPRAWPVVRYSALAAGLVVAFTAGRWWSSRVSVTSDSAEQQRLAQRLAATETEREQLRGSLADARRQLERSTQPQANLPMVELVPSAARQRSEETVETELVVPADAPRVALLLTSPVPSSRPVTLELRDEAGKVLWSSQGVRPGPLGGYTLGVPARLLPEGRVRVAVLAEPGAKPFETYTLRVRRR